MKISSAAVVIVLGFVAGFLLYEFVLKSILMSA